nr:hypothetical protein Iba_chr13eCG3740 [Ipomoea batatas]
MAANNRYYSKRELTEIGMEGFALIDEFYGGGRKHKTLPNYVYSSYKPAAAAVFPERLKTVAVTVTHRLNLSSVMLQRLRPRRKRLR